MKLFFLPFKNKQRDLFKVGNKVCVTDTCREIQKCLLTPRGTKVKYGLEMRVILIQSVCKMLITQHILSSLLFKISVIFISFLGIKLSLRLWLVVNSGA